MVPLSLRTLHRHAEPPGRAAAGGGVPAMGQVGHARRAGVLCAVTCKHTAITNQIAPLSWRHSEQAGQLQNSISAPMYRSLDIYL